MNIRYFHFNSVKKYGVGGLCPYTYSNEIGEFSYYRDPPCYAGIMGGGVEQLVVDITIAENTKRVKNNPLYWRRFFDYIVTRSPFSKYFLTEDFDEANKWGVYLENVEKPHLAAITALREGWEYSHDTMYMWNVFVNNGINEHLAFVLGCFFREEGGEYFKTSPDGHSPFSWSMDIPQVKEYLSLGLNGEEKTIHGCTRSLAGTGGLEKLLSKNEFVIIRNEGSFCQHSHFKEEGVISLAKHIEELVQ